MTKAVSKILYIATITSRCTEFYTSTCNNTYILKSYITDNQIQVTCRWGQAASKLGSSSSGSYSAPTGFEEGGKVRKVFTAN